MARQATEVVVAAGAAPLRIVCLHLEFHSLAKRPAQVARLRVLQREAPECVIPTERLPSVIPAEFLPYVIPAERNESRDPVKTFARRA